MNRIVNGKRGFFSVPTGIILCLLFIIFSAPVLAEEQKTGQDHSKSLVLMYIVGSDLESGEGHAEGGDGTTDILNLVKGYGNTSPDDLNIIVAYGGSKAPGWEGMTITPVEGLIQDAADGVIGNEGIGAFIDPTMDMGSTAGLSTFLSAVKSTYTGDTTYLIFWNHGNGFSGFGWDEITGNHLSIPDIITTLESSGGTYDLIGFDACLMSGLEVAQAMRPYAKYMIASEEISAGGWTYHEWVADLAKNPGQNAASAGRMIIDSFFHRDEPNGNTAALVDLSKIEPIQRSLDDLGAALNETLLPESSILPIARAYEKTTRFGENVDNGDQQALKIDLGTLADYLAESTPATEESVKNLKASLKEAIVYEHHDELMSNATGLSIADPLTLTDTDYQEIADTLSISPGWDAFVQKVREHLKREVPTPDIASVGTSTYSLKDATGFEDVSVSYFAIDNETGDLLQLGTLPVPYQEDGTYEFPDWDGEWYYFQDSENPNQYILIDLDYGDTTGTGISKFISKVDIIRNGTLHDTMMYSYLDPDSNWTRYSLRPYNIAENGQVIFSRSGFTPRPGDSFISYASAFGQNGTEIGMVEIGEMTTTGMPEMYSGLLPDGLYGWALTVRTAKDKTDVSDIRLLSIGNGTVTQLRDIKEEERNVSQQNLNP